MQSQRRPSHLCCETTLSCTQLQAQDFDKDYRQPFRRFESECQCLSRINHPNIVQYLGMYMYVDPDTNALILLMELMDESLTHFLESSLESVFYK